MPRLKIVVGGSARGVGKTSLVCGLIAAMREHSWTAVKITSHAHQGRDSIYEEKGAGTDRRGDTFRYLRAGAARSFLVTADEGNSPVGLISTGLEAAQDILIETTRFAGDFKPDLCIGVLGDASTPVKESFRPFLLRADALVVRTDHEVRLDGIPSGIPVFRLGALDQISPEMLEWLWPLMIKARTRGLVRA
jgi:hypothetical protein